MTLISACEGLRVSEPEPRELDLVDVREVCRLFGGSRPIHPATLYRGIRKGRYPAPVKVGPGSSRWLRNECEAALQSMAEGRAAR